MAKILYGICGEGLGHSTRSKVTIEHLLAEGHQLKIVSYDRGYKWLKNYFEIEEISGPRLIYSDNELQYIETIFKNVLKTPEVVRSIEKVSGIASEFKPDLVITDFEPISALVAGLKKIPIISIDNMHILCRTKINYPLKYIREYMTAKLITKLMVFGAKHYFITSFFKAEEIEAKTTIVPPIVRKEVLDSKPVDGDYILVYLTSKADNIVEKLTGTSGKYVVYGYGFEEQKIVGNVEFRKFGQTEFLADLAGCKAIIANAGFSLISEALYLGKPFLAMPAAKQFEQTLNAYYIEKYGYGAMVEDLNVDIIEAFIQRLDSYKLELSKYKKQDNSVLFKDLDEKIGELVK